MLTQIPTLEDRPGAVIKPHSRKPIGLGVHSRDASTLPVAHRILLLCCGCGRVDGDGGVVAAGHDEIPHADCLFCNTSDGGRVRCGVLGVQAVVQRVGDLTGVAH